MFKPILLSYIHLKRQWPKPAAPTFKGRRLTSSKAVFSEAKTSTCSRKEINNWGIIKNPSEHSPGSLSPVSQVSWLLGGGQENLGEFSQASGLHWEDAPAWMCVGASPSTGPLLTSRDAAQPWQWGESRTQDNNPQVGPCSRQSGHIWNAAEQEFLRAVL